MSNGVTYAQSGPDHNVGVSSPGYMNYGISGATTSSILTTTGNEDFTIDPSFAVWGIGFDIYTINRVGEPNTVPGALPVQVSVETTGGSFGFEVVAPAGNFGLGISSTDEIVQVRWKAHLGGVRNTGIGNVRFNPVPEPTTLALIGMASLAFLRRRK